MDSHSDFLFKRNKFVKKIWSSKDKRYYPNRKNILLDSVQLQVNKIRSWNTEVNYFVVLNILLSLDILNKNRLKNIFQRNYYIDNTFWFEIDKMISSNIINFSDSFIYSSSKNNFFSSIMSTFLLEIYLNELDSYFLQYSFIHNLRKNVKNNFGMLRKSEDIVGIKKDFLPIRLENNLARHKNLRSFLIMKSNFFKTFFKKNVDSFATFEKHIFYARYLNHTLIGFIGSNNFVESFCRKIKNFVRSSLHFDIRNINTFYSTERNINFCGFDIRLLEKSVDNILTSSSIRTKRKFSAKISSRIISNQRKIVRDFSFRFQDELFFHIKNILKEKSLQSLSLKDYKIWTYVFQLEAVRATQLNKLVMSSEKTYLISEELFTRVKYSRIKTYENYSFNLYISKLQIMLKEAINHFSIEIPTSVVSSDLYFTLLLRDFRKKLFIFYENIFLQNKKDSSLDFSNTNYSFFSPVYNSYFLGNDISTIKKELSTDRIDKSRKVFEIFIPMKFCLRKLRTIGIIHSNRKRPIGNQKLLRLEDLKIIKYFGHISFAFLNWFKCCYNISNLKFLITIIRQSCFLTLCRKHNKNKSWAYRVYTPDLIVSRRYQAGYSYFPSRKFILNFKRVFIFSKSESNFDEEFFLT